MSSNESGNLWFLQPPPSGADPNQQISPTPPSQQTHQSPNPANPFNKLTQSPPPQDGYGQQPYPPQQGSPYPPPQQGSPYPQKQGTPQYASQPGSSFPQQGPPYPSKVTLHNSRDLTLLNRTFTLNLDHSRNSRVLLIPNKASLNKRMLNRSNSQIPIPKLVAKPLRFMVPVPRPSFSRVQVPAALATAGSSITRCRWLVFNSLRPDRTVWRGVGSLRARTLLTHLPRCSSAPLPPITVTSNSSP
jgi:hypothetical protein